MHLTMSTSNSSPLAQQRHVRIRSEHQGDAALAEQCHIPALERGGRQLVQCTEKPAQGQAQEPGHTQPPVLMCTHTRSHTLTCSHTRSPTLT